MEQVEPTGFERLANEALQDYHEGRTEVLGQRKCDRPKPKPLREIAEIFELVAAKFGLTTDILITKGEGNKRSSVNVPRNVAIYVSLLAGHMRSEVAVFTGREYTAVRQVQERLKKRPLQLGMAWEMWQEIGGTWDNFKPVDREMARPCSQDYVIKNLSLKNEKGEVVPVPQYFDVGFGLASTILEYLGLSQPVDGEALICQHMIRQAINDYLIGMDASRWVNEERSEGSQGITFVQACAALSIDDGWLRRKFKELEKFMLEKD